MPATAGMTTRRLRRYEYVDEHDDRRWLWVATVAGIVLLIAVAGTMMILSGGDSGTTSATVYSATVLDQPGRTISQRRPVPERHPDAVCDGAATGDHHQRVADADATARPARRPPRPRHLPRQSRAPSPTT